jgi:hypothetical protein
MKKLLCAGLIAIVLSCQEPPSRDCGRFQQGSFRFTTTVDGQEETTVFTRTRDLEISEFRGRKDSASIRWINDCEYVVTNLNPKNRGEEKPIHMKILTTAEDSYTFEYKLVGSANSSRGTAYKIE